MKKQEKKQEKKQATKSVSTQAPQKLQKPPVIRTPFGPLAAFREHNGTLRVEWGERTAARTRSEAEPASKNLLDRLALAATGKATKFSDVPTPAGTAFQRRCWTICRNIPRGRTLTYGEVAKRAGSPGAARAVGQAMRSNPIPLIVPCHRVVATNGLGGYAGTDRSADARCKRKAGLLELERVR